MYSNSNYPPGVTGRELEIAGPDWEGEMDVKCAGENVEVTVFRPDDIETLKRIAAVKGAQGAGKQRDADVIQMSLRRMLSRMVTVTLPVCPFEGEVEAWMYQHVTHWECPVCGTSHDEDDRE
ncbi:MAG: hypothetical protein WCI34_08215 [Actinomycetes bacterium]